MPRWPLSLGIVYALSPTFHFGVRTTHIHAIQGAIAYVLLIDDRIPKVSYIFNPVVALSPDGSVNTLVDD